MFVKYNQHLKQRYNARDEIDPISLNDIDVCNEWLVGEMDEDDDNDVGNDLVFEDDDIRRKKRESVRCILGGKKGKKATDKCWY